MAKSQKKNKKIFLAVFLGDSASMKKWEKLPAKKRNELEVEGMRAWHEWATTHRKSIAHMGGPLGTTKRIDRKGDCHTLPVSPSYPRLGRFARHLDHDIRGLPNRRQSTL